MTNPKPIMTPQFLAARKTSWDAARNARRMSFKRQLEAVLAEKTVDDEGKVMTKLERIARVAVKAAMEGDWKAREFVTDRVMGKPLQGVVMANGDVGFGSQQNNNDTIRGFRLVIIDADGTLSNQKPGAVETELLPRAPAPTPEQLIAATVALNSDEPMDEPD